VTLVGLRCRAAFNTGVAAATPYRHGGFPGWGERPRELELIGVVLVLVLEALGKGRVISIFALTSRSEN